MPVVCSLCNKRVEDLSKCGWFEPDESEWGAMTEKQRKTFNPFVGGMTRMVHLSCGYELTQKASMMINGEDDKNE